MEAWIPLLQSLVWPVFIGLMILAFRGWFRDLLEVIRRRVESGSEVSVGPGGFSLGSAPKLDQPEAEAEAAPEIFERYAEESKKIPSEQKKSALEVSKLFRIIHSATLNPDMSKQQGRPYYTIRAWLEADVPDLLRRVEKVVYHLHPTFPNPEREIDDRDSNFAMTTYGWGQFNLSADVHFTDGSEPLKLFRYINF
jgi:hypothetical protein